MYNWLLTLISACLYYSGLVELSCWWTRRAGPRLVILNYHEASGGDLRRHLLYLRHHYRILHLEAALEELYMPNKSRLQNKDRRTMLALTFDDGYHDNYTHAFKLACELQTPITIFLVPGYIESGNRFWWLEGNPLVSHAQVSQVTIEGRTYALDKLDERKALVQAIDDCLRYATSVAEREQFLVSIRKALAVSSAVITEGEEHALLPLTWTEVQEMGESEWISFGAHTMHHPILAYLADPTEVQYEVSECRIVLERQLGHPISTFAYPVGLFQHIGEQGLRAVWQAKFNWALTTMYGFNTAQTSPFLLRRIVVGADQHWLMVAAKASGIWGFFSRPCWRLIALFVKDHTRLIQFTQFLEKERKEHR